MPPLSGRARILTVAVIAAFFIVAFLGLVLGNGLHRNPHPPEQREDQCEPLTTDKDPNAVVLEPQNTWSNWAYLLVGVVILYRSRNLLGAFVGLNLAFEFLFSALYHGKLTDSTQFMDVAWIYVLLLSLIVWASQSVFVWVYDAPRAGSSEPLARDWVSATGHPYLDYKVLVTLGAALSTVGLGIAIRCIHPDSTRATLGLAFILAIVMFLVYLWKLISLLLRFVWPPELPPWHWDHWLEFGLMVVVGITALVVRLSDGISDGQDKWLCSRHEGTLQAHAVWHVLSALLVLVVYDFFCRLYFPEQGRVFTNWLADA